MIVRCANTIEVTISFGCSSYPNDFFCCLTIEHPANHLKMFACFYRIASPHTRNITDRILIVSIGLAFQEGNTSALKQRDCLPDDNAIVFAFEVALDVNKVYLPFCCSRRRNNWPALVTRSGPSK